MQPHFVRHSLVRFHTHDLINITKFSKSQSLASGGRVLFQRSLFYGNRRFQFLILRHPNSTSAHPHPSFASAVKSCQIAFSTDSTAESSSTESSFVRQNNSVVVAHDKTGNFLESVFSRTIQTLQLNLKPLTFTSWPNLLTKT